MGNGPSALPPLFRLVPLSFARLSHLQLSARDSSIAMASDRLGRDGTELDPLGWEAFKSLLEKIELPALSSLSSLRERMSEVETFLCPPVWRCVETRARERLFDIFRGLETTQRTRALTARDVVRFRFPKPCRSTPEGV